MKDCDSETDGNDIESSESFESFECAIPLIKEKDNGWVVHAERVKTLAGWMHGVAVMILTGLSILLCLIFYFTCPKCLFYILILSACMCPWIHSMNAPLWLAIVLLVLSGWTFTYGYMSVTWNDGLR